MIGKILAHLLGNPDEDITSPTDVTYEDLIEFEEGGWVIINIQENLCLTPPEVHRLENLLIEHPSMSVYQMRGQMSDKEDLGSDEDEEDSPRPVPVKQHLSWRLAAWGTLLPSNVHLLTVQRTRNHTERKRLTRSAFQRQNLAKVRFSPSERRYGHFKQPCQRLYNY